MIECPFCDGEVFQDLQTLAWHLYEAGHLPAMRTKSGKEVRKKVQSGQGYVTCWCGLPYWLGPQGGALANYTLAYHLEEKGGVARHLLECKLGVES